MADEQSHPTPAGRRLQHLKLAVVVPLTVLGLVLGAVLLQHSGDLTPTGLAVPSPIDLSISTLHSEANTNSTRKPTMQEVMQVVHQYICHIYFPTI